MPALVIIDLEVHDFDLMARYEEQAIGLLEKYNARPIVRNFEADLYEGERRPSWLVVLEFPDKDTVRAFYDSPEYQPMKQLRWKAAKSKSIVVTETL
ncbi:hypothetical protein CIW68_08265 [Enterobacter cloacae]|uniref:DUF1330 domain-containing protein n=1 Tax=Enterobacter cloacae TaxID=550 RepID=UPI000BA8A494|nr:DUF1330 domain-containing protein [Enterobacter cloacae]MDW3563488.1 DUF1330 domain-containing protein [Enterobacter cloacae]PAN76427.1 hypothetical protein CIW68_08265 [Enterobacter cloacae]WNJ09260.1 DUF1330 domain-containing protein [Enterobacter cloacae]